MKRVPVLDGSLNGKRGNTSMVVESLIKLLEPVIHIDYIELKDVISFTTLEERLTKADGFIIATGTYWQS